MSSLTTLEDQVKLKLKETVAEFIPEERWNAIVQRTVQEFEQKDLPNLIREELNKRYRAAINEELSKPEWQQMWNGSQQDVGPALKQLLIDAAPQMFAAVITGIAQQTLYNFQNNAVRY